MLSKVLAWLTAFLLLGGAITSAFFAREFIKQGHNIHHHAKLSNHTLNATAPFYIPYPTQYIVTDFGPSTSGVATFSDYVPTTTQTNTTLVVVPTISSVTTVYDAVSTSSSEVERPISTGRLDASTVLRPSRTKLTTIYVKSKGKSKVLRSPATEVTVTTLPSLVLLTHTILLNATITSKIPVILGHPGSATSTALAVNITGRPLSTYLTMTWNFYRIDPKYEVANIATSYFLSTTATRFSVSMLPSATPTPTVSLHPVQRRSKPDETPKKDTVLSVNEYVKEIREIKGGFLNLPVYNTFQLENGTYDQPWNVRPGKIAFRKWMESDNITTPHGLAVWFQMNKNADTTTNETILQERWERFNKEVTSQHKREKTNKYGISAALLLTSILSALGALLLPLLAHRSKAQGPAPHPVRAQRSYEPKPKHAPAVSASFNPPPSGINRAPTAPANSGVTRTPTAPTPAPANLTPSRRGTVAPEPAPEPAPPLVEIRKQPTAPAQQPQTAPPQESVTFTSA